MNKNLYLIRGVPGSGKTIFAKSCAKKLVGTVRHEADQWFEFFNDSKFDASKLPLAHSWCKTNVEQSMDFKYEGIFVSNTFIKRWEMQVYYDLAKKYGYTVHELIMNGKFKSVHNVPESTIAKMKANFEY